MTATVTEDRSDVGLTSNWSQTVTQTLHVEEYDAPVEPPTTPDYTRLPCDSSRWDNGTSAPHFGDRYCGQNHNSRYNWTDFKAYTDFSTASHVCLEETIAIPSLRRAGDTLVCGVAEGECAETFTRGDHSVHDDGTNVWQWINVSPVGSWTESGSAHRSVCP